MEAAVLLPGSTALSFYIQYSSCGPVGCCPILPYWLPQYLCQGRTSLLCRIPSNSASTTFWHAKLSEPRWHAGAPVHPGALAMPSEASFAQALTVKQSGRPTSRWYQATLTFSVITESSRRPPAASLRIMLRHSGSGCLHFSRLPIVKR